jgi:integrative and conjugative element protein (TIGR02256 family)
MNAWRHPYQFSLVIASTECLSIISSFKQDQFEIPESGGILLGHRRGGHIEIIAATEPCPKDIRRRAFFHRRDPAHQETAIHLWRESKGEVDYVGEWHTHAELHPTPSGLDHQQWRKASLAYRKPLVAIIVGVKNNFCAWICDGEYVPLNNIK